MSFIKLPTQQTHKDAEPSQKRGMQPTVSTGLGHLLKVDGLSGSSGLPKSKSVPTQSSNLETLERLCDECEECRLYLGEGRGDWIQRLIRNQRTVSARGIPADHYSDTEQVPGARNCTHLSTINFSAHICLPCTTLFCKFWLPI